MLKRLSALGYEDQQAGIISVLHYGIAAPTPTLILIHQHSELLVLLYL